MNHALVFAATFAIAVAAIGLPVMMILWLRSLFRRRR